MAKETEDKLIKTLEFLRDPQGSTIPEIVKVMNGQEPQVSLKKIMQTLRGCVKNGTLKMDDDRVKLNENELTNADSRWRGNAIEHSCDQFSNQYPNNSLLSRKANKSKKGKNGIEEDEDHLVFEELYDEGEEGGGEAEAEGDGEGEGGGEGGNPSCPCSTKKPRKKAKKKRCPKKKPKCPKKKPKSKCPKSKPKKCAKRKIQSYCKKKRVC